MDKPLVTISYKLANGSQISVEVSTAVKELLEQSDRQIRSQRRQDRRHLDFKVSQMEIRQALCYPHMRIPPTCWKEWNATPGYICRHSRTQ
ncbi:hypothetical protein Psch_00657 [Pelotomaculum schinkii]|uniref:Uncharacterized protein n=1 Tax=Pelotomaculum schinkii TaxID=78350 RepID=A0A4Y7RDN9_9FIRM|nr:hypothetical protein [Pelotomaculum schinkii]TEB07114.1 hypothetical protein Psch_00657 [Pelotomaculum schinkii]